MPLILLLPNMVTILGLCFGLTSIRFAFEDRFELAAGLLMLAAIFDGIDGLLARRLNAASPFGAELDSLSDFVCFGVAPALIVYHFGLGGMGGTGWIAALTFAICCCLRLARFNVAAKDETNDAGSFTGVPAPAGAMLGLFPVTLHLAGYVDLRDVQLLIAAWMLFVGGLMIARFPTISLKAMRISRDNAVYVLLAGAIVIGLMLTRLWTFHVGASVLYLGLLAWGLLRRRRA
ncbi:CDP-diacylglycerol--serine O-phosphatidyltransferase [Jannaschia pagri]|uniref:CDP-diacylglycerol--serine O-phosphatidyltransferase n=1 Tax=Jannaschia pagri TaxID=2829797 RepID=A0ABQ4NHZ0_9RHOB|nr:MULTISPECIES: CDP-diacylglycerol--serine O-phosphatidyltransferase [unclassified Jannaschia]GIT89850.1 CDP-diacylglycerol--serine O-phosphatidyltransferase [Jannaschia sp. AI_61]GIT94043.1 CDP-diacylglycerol--serine O-phosphatidyltransferase [Jannaschia sp. AI_62]